MIDEFNVNTQTGESRGTEEAPLEEIARPLEQQDPTSTPEPEAQAVSPGQAPEQEPHGPELTPVSETTGTPPPGTGRLSSVRRAGGPKTAQGKLRSKYNALRSGFFAKEGAIATAFYDESRKEYRRRLREFIIDLEPVGVAETVQIEIMAMLLLNYRRLKRVEQALILERFTPLPRDDKAAVDLLAQEEAERQEALRNSEGRSPGPLDEFRQRLERMKKKVADEDAPLRAERARINALKKSLPNFDDFEWLQQCEGHILRQYYRAGAELERLQRMRLRLPPPPTIKVDVSSG